MFALATTETFITHENQYNNVGADGDIDESNLEIILDNDGTGFYIKSDDDAWDSTILNGNGYFDIKELYELLFPKATVEWC